MVQFFNNITVVERKQSRPQDFKSFLVTRIILRTCGFGTAEEHRLLNHRGTLKLGGTVKELEERILRDGKNLGGGILKVDSFVNHQVDPLLMDACGREFARRFAPVHATKVLTAEISGIAPALMTAVHLGLPVVYARKTKPITMPDQVYLTLAPSHTKGRTVELIVSPEYLANNERVLIIDDFLASGQTILGLVRLAEASGSKVVGIGALIEKSFEGGRDVLQSVGVPVESLACITKMEDGRIEFKA